MKNKLTVQQKLDNNFYGMKSSFMKDAVRVKDVDLSKRIVTGYFNSFNFFDSDYDVIAKGAFAKSISEHGPDSSGVKIKHCLFHDLSRLPGKIEVLREDDFGEYFETRMVDTDTLEKYQAGIYDNHSIGFRYVPGKIELYEEGENAFEVIVESLKNPEEARENGFLYYVTEVKQHEGSTVAFGANSATPFMGVKSEEKELAIIKELEKLSRMESLLRNGTLTDEGFKDLELTICQTKQFLFNFKESLKQPQKPTFQKEKPGSTDREEKNDLFTLISEKI